MPAFIVHGFIGYLVYGKMGFYLGILPDIIGFGYYFSRAHLTHVSHWGLSFCHDYKHFDFFLRRLS